MLNFPGNNQMHLCPSGIPSYFFSPVDKKFNKKMKICFVGHLAKRKFPDSIIKALLLIKNNNFQSVSFYGDGPQLNKIKKYKKLSFYINLYGYIARKKLPSEFDNHDIFIMISKKEAFGLVYLEAMSRGLITIAAENEGMDGIIVDNINGFLVPAGDYIKLSKVLELIQSMSDNEKIKISKNAIKTAKLYSNNQVANQYLNNIHNA